MLSILGPICGLLGTTDSAAQGSVAFFKGIAVAVVVAGVMVFGVLPHVTAFPTLLIAVLPVIALGAVRHATSRRSRPPAQPS